jgi:hypothetical protein
MAAGPSVTPEAAALAARSIALQMLEERGRGAVLVGVARVDAALEHLLQAVMAPAGGKGDSLFQPERPLGSIGAKVALARRLGLIDEPVERALQVLRKLRNAFAHSAESASLADSCHSSRLEEVYVAARGNPLWAPLEIALTAQAPSAQGPVESPLRDYILLITILVAYLEATAQRLKPFQPPVAMGFSGICRSDDGV